MKNTTCPCDAANEIAKNAVLDCCENQELADHIIDEFWFEFEREVSTLDEAYAAHELAQKIAQDYIEYITDHSPKTYALPRECNGHKEW